MEAMKMEHTLTAPRDGELSEVDAVAGSQTAEGAILVKLEPLAGMNSPRTRIRESFIVPACTLDLQQSRSEFTSAQSGHIRPRRSGRSPTGHPGREMTPCLPSLSVRGHLGQSHPGGRPRARARRGRAAAGHARRFPRYAGTSGNGRPPHRVRSLCRRRRAVQASLWSTATTRSSTPSCDGWREERQADIRIFADDLRFSLGDARVAGLWRCAGRSISGTRSRPMTAQSTSSSPPA